MRSTRLWTILRAQTRQTSGPKTLLGRWCGPWYSPACDAMNKGWLADVDNSAWSPPPPDFRNGLSMRKRAVSEPSGRDPISVFVVEA